MASRSRRGFSLIELLVVVVIVVMLAGLLLPAIRMVKTTALTANCASNLRQISIASLAYADDNDGGLCPAWGVLPDGSAPLYIDFLFPYIGMNSGTSNKQKKNVYICPAGRRMLIASEGGSDWLWNYSMNQSLHTNYYAPSWRVTYLGRVRSQSETVDIADGTQPESIVSGVSAKNIFVWKNWTGNLQYYDDDPGWTAVLSGSDPDRQLGMIRYRHGSSGYGGQLCDIAWLDGHVAPVGHRVLVKDSNFAPYLLP